MICSNIIEEASFILGAVAVGSGPQTLEAGSLSSIRLMLS